MIMVNSKANIYMKGGQLQEVSHPLQGMECTATVLVLIITPPSLVQCHKKVYNIFLLLLFLLLFKTSTEVPTQHSHYIYFIKISAAFGYTVY